MRMILKLEDCIQNAINNLQKSCCSFNRPQNMTCPAFKTLSPSIKFREEGADFVNWHNSFNETLIFQKNFLNWEKSSPIRRRAKFRSLSDDRWKLIRKAAPPPSSHMKVLFCMVFINKFKQLLEKWKHFLNSNNCFYW